MQKCILDVQFRIVAGLRTGVEQRLNCVAATQFGSRRAARTVLGTWPEDHDDASWAANSPRSATVPVLPWASKLVGLLILLGLLLCRYCRGLRKQKKSLCCFIAQLSGAPLHACCKVLMQCMRRYERVSGCMQQAKCVVLRKTRESLASAGRNK